MDHFLKRQAKDTPLKTVTKEAMELLMKYDWPGNVRELENVIERAVVLCTGDVVGLDLIPDQVKSRRVFRRPNVAIPPGGLDFNEEMADYAKRLIESTLEEAGGEGDTLDRLHGLGRRHACLQEDLQQLLDGPYLGRGAQ